MIVLPRHDLIRAEVDNLHASCFIQCTSFRAAHTVFISKLNQAFSRLTESVAFNYAADRFSADIRDLSQHYSVVRNGHKYEIHLIIGDEATDIVKSAVFIQSFDNVEVAMETCRVVNKLFNVFEGQ